MKPTFRTLTVVAALSAGALSTGAIAASASDIRVSTDPAKIAAIEKHAKELQARESATPAKTAAPMDAAKPAKAAKPSRKAHKAHKHHARKPAKA